MQPLRERPQVARQVARSMPSESVGLRIFVRRRASLQNLRRAAADCRAWDLWKHATQMWFYITALAQMLGAEVNAELLHSKGQQLPEKKTPDDFISLQTQARISGRQSA